MKKRIIFVCIFIVSVVFLYGIFSLILFDTSAKYTNYNEMNHYYKSNNLYISSDSLSFLDDNYKIINYYNYENLEFEIYNYINDNQITSYDIEYELKCNVLGDAKDYYNCVIDDMEDDDGRYTIISDGVCEEDNLLNMEECLFNEYDFILNKNKKVHNVKLIKNNDNDYNKVEIEIVLNTTNPFNKKLKSIYILNLLNKDDGKIDVEVSDYDYFCKYILKNNYDINQLIQLNIDNNKLIYNKDDNIFNSSVEYINDNSLINSIKFDINGFSKQEIIINKKNFSEECLNSYITYRIVK